MSPAGDKPKTEREARGRLKSAPRKESSKSNAASSLREIAERFERDLSHWETFLPDVYSCDFSQQTNQAQSGEGDPDPYRVGYPGEPSDPEHIRIKAKAVYV